MRKLHPFNQKCNFKIDPVTEVHLAGLFGFLLYYESACTHRNTTLLKIEC